MGSRGCCVGGMGISAREALRKAHEGTEWLHVFGCGSLRVRMGWPGVLMRQSSLTHAYTPTGHMNSQQLLPRVLQNEPRDAGPTNADDLHSSVVRESELPSGAPTPSGPPGATPCSAVCNSLLMCGQVR